MIPGLDGLRAIAILLVFASHTDLIVFGWVGVQLFFVLSGFLITGILLEMKETLPRGQYFVSFYGRRFLRIFPLYYFYLALMAIVAFGLIKIDFRPNYMRIFFDQAGYAVSYVYDFVYRLPWLEPSRFLDHFWSLAVEEQFYIVWPLLLLLVPQKHLRSLFLVFILLGPVFRVLMYLWYLSGSSLWPFRDPIGLVIYSWPLSHVDAFALGAYISRYPLWRPRLQLSVLAMLVPALGFLATYSSSGSLGALSALGYDLAVDAGYEFLWAHTLLNYFFAVLIYCVVRERLWVRFLELPWLRYLGRISYGLYVYHLALIWFVWRLAEEWLPQDFPLWVRPVVALCLTLLIATLSYYLLERPILGLKDRFFSWSNMKSEEPGSAMIFAQHPERDHQAEDIDRKSE